MKRKAPRGPNPLLARAFHLYQAGHREEAEGVLRELLGGAPRLGDAVHLLGVIRGERGDSAEALALLTRAVELLPGSVDAWRNLGNVCFERGEHERAEACFRHVLSIAPGDVASRGNLALILDAGKRYEEALTEARRVRRQIPDDPAVAKLVARLLRNTRRHEEEIAIARELLAADPGDASLRRALGNSYALWFDREATDPARSLRVLEEWSAFDPHDPVARHLLAARGAREAPARASDAYVTRYFDDFAATFDEVLDEIGYRGPELLRAALDAAEPTADATCAVADLGCGTGKCGPILRPRASSLTGVDLSEKMLALARARGLYDDLVLGEITPFLEARPGAFDLVVAADVLPYFGDLEPLFAAMARALRPRGLFVASVESLEGEASYRLLPVGRYAHADGYVQGLLERLGLRVERVERTELRKERGVPVPSLVVTARLPNT